MDSYFRAFGFGLRMGALASFGMPSLAADEFVHQFMQSRGAGLTNALSMAFQASRGAFGRMGRAYRWYMGNIAQHRDYEPSFLRYGANIGLLSPVVSLWGIYRGARLYQRGRNPYSRAAGIAMMALSAGGMVYGVRTGMGFTDTLLNGYLSFKAGSADDARIPSYGLPAGGE